jgi:hypothetical protein
MKKIYLFVLIILLGLVFLPTDHGSAQNSDNYYSIRDSLTTFYNANPSLKSEKEGNYLQFIRWQKFWGRRVYGGDSNKRGSFL